MKKSKKTGKIIFLIICILTLFSNIFVDASVVSQFSGEITGYATNAQTSAIKILSSILDIIRTIGAAVAVIILIVIACKYIIASAGDRADIKKYATTYVIGALILFGASGITSLIKNFIDNSIK